MKQTATSKQKTASKKDKKPAAKAKKNVQHKKMTLEERQTIRLKTQQEREKAKEGHEPKNIDRFYCTSKELQHELLIWRNSDPEGLPVLKLKDGKLVKTAVESTPEQHEKYEDGTQYFVKIPKSSEKLYQKAIEQLAKKNEDITDPKKQLKFESDTKDYVTLDVTDIVRHEGWAFNYDIVESRVPTNRLGEMMIMIGNKLLNHSSFRNYDPDLKLEMRGQFFLKLMKGLKNYNFKFNNPFAFFTTVAWNSFLIVLNKYYKNQNIIKELKKQIAEELQAYSGFANNAGLSRCIKMYLENDTSDNG